MPGSRTSSTITSGRRGGGRFQPLFGRGRRGHAVAQRLGQLGQPPANARFVVDDQQMGHGGQGRG